MSGIDNDKQEDWLSLKKWQEHWQGDLYGEMEDELLETENRDGPWQEDNTTATVIRQSLPETRGQN